MNTDILNQKFFQQGTPGYAVIRNFYARYSDVLAYLDLPSINDVIHEVFLSLSKTNFAKVENIEHYAMRAIKLQCWSLLDKALRRKSASGGSSTNQIERESSLQETENSELSELEGLELLAQVSRFKGELTPREIRLLNMMIDGTERKEMTVILNMNLNTLDTMIRRLRIRLANYLKELGYSYGVLDRFA